MEIIFKSTNPYDPLRLTLNDTFPGFGGLDNFNIFSRFEVYCVDIMTAFYYRQMLLDI